MSPRSLVRCATGAATTLVALGVLSLVGCVPDAPSQPADSQEQVSSPEDGDPDVVRFPSTNRPDVRGATGAVSSGHPLATAAGYAVLQRGGNAVDAAIAMAGVLAVVRPHMNGVGGDAFGLFYVAEQKQVVALNGSGRAGALATPDFFAERELQAVPQTGALSITVPGAVGAWEAAAERFGTMPLSELLEPAIRYATEGFPVSSRLRQDFASQSGALGDAGRALYLPGGEPPPAGSLLKNPALGSTLQRIADKGADGFYLGPVAQSLASFIESEGGYLRVDDFPNQEPNWVEPLGADYLDYRLLVLPPNTQGIAQLQQAEMAKSFDFKGMGHNTSDYLHTMIEVKKLAFADRNRWVSDPEFAPAPLDRLLDPEYLKERATLVDPTRAAENVAAGIAPVADDGDRDGLDDSGDTVYLTAVDRWGNAVSWIQSLFAGFGSGLLDDQTGVLLHNRGALFTLEESHPNVITPGKRPYHTLTPMMALRGGELGFTIGTPGGDGQTQTLLQIVHNLLLFGMTPQEAIEAPRFRSYPGLRVAMEDRIDPGVRDDLAGRGHTIDLIHGWTATFGGAQMIFVDPEAGTLAVAADPRREAYALAY